MSRAVAVPTISRSAALIVTGLVCLVLAQVLFLLAIEVGTGSTDRASYYGEPDQGSGATVLAVLGGFAALAGGSVLLTGVYRVLANVDRYLAFRVAVMPRRAEPVAQQGALPEERSAGYGYAPGAVR